MKRILLALVLLLSPAVAGTGSAADCRAAAEKAASKEKAELLSAEASGPDCEVKLLLPGKDGKPGRIVTKKVKG